MEIVGWKKYLNIENTENKKWHTGTKVGQNTLLLKVIRDAYSWTLNFFPKSQFPGDAGSSEWKNCFQRTWNFFLSIA